MNAIKLSSIQFAAASPKDQATGLLGYLAFTLGPLRVDGVTVRRLADSGRLALSFPCRRDRRGRSYPIVCPLGDRERRAIEHAVFQALGIEEPASS